MSEKQLKRKRRGSEESSSLDYLNEQEEIDDSKIDPELSKRDRSWLDNNRSSDIPKKVHINTKKKEKYVENEQFNEGIYLYKPGVSLPDLQFCNQNITVIIAAEYINKSRCEMLKEKVYGTDTYTSNSDLLGVAIHAGYLNVESFNHQKYQGVEIYFKVIKPRRNYLGSYRNGIISKSVKTYNEFALKPESQKFLPSLPPMKYLEQYAGNMQKPKGTSRKRPIPVNINEIVPIPQTHLTFNMNNEPAYKYNIINIADKGYDHTQFLAAKLDTLVLYLETAEGQKFQLYKMIQNVYFTVFCFFKLKNPLKCDNLFFKNHGSPLPEDDKQLIHHGIEWDQIVWSNEGVMIKDSKIEGVTSFKFYDKTRQV